MNEDTGCIAAVVGLALAVGACGLGGGALWWSSKLADRVETLEAEINAVNRAGAESWDPDPQQQVEIDELRDELQRVEFEVETHTSDTARSAHDGL